MEKTLPLLKGSISLEDALAEDEDILQRLMYPEKQKDFWIHLCESRDQIAEVVSRHLNISQSDFELGDVDESIYGSFNACLPVYITPRRGTSHLTTRAVVRFALPYKVGEEFNPGNVEEKVRCEAATHIWLRRECPSVPASRLLGFGLPGEQSFTAVENESFIRRIIWWFRAKRLKWKTGEQLVPYFAHSRSQLPDLGYVIVEHSDEGTVLSDTWEGHRTDMKKREKLFRGLSRIMLDLAKVPLPRIGSWTIDDRGVLSLTNRPLTGLVHRLENLQIPTDIPRDQTYTSVEPYALDLLTCQDNRLREQPNSIHDQADGEAQLSALMCMRALLPKLFDRSARHGPFVMSLTNLSQNNIYVDENWNISRIVDLEWACTRPLDMVSPPPWITGEGLDEIVFSLDNFAEVYEEFLDIFNEEEMTRSETNDNGKRLDAIWEAGSYWYFQALDSPSNALTIFIDHIQPRFDKLDCEGRAGFSRSIAPYWDKNAGDFIASKVAEQEVYLNRVRDAFSAGTMVKPPQSEYGAFSDWSTADTLIV